MRNQEWDSSFTELHSLHLAQLVFGFCALNAVHGEPAFGVVNQAEMFTGLVDRDHIHVPSRVGRVCPHLAVDLNKALHDDLLDLSAIEGIFEAVADKDDERKAVTELVGTGGWTRGVGSREFIEEPVRWCAEALLMLLSGRELRVSDCTYQLLPRCRDFLQ